MGLHSYSLKVIYSYSAMGLHSYSLKVNYSLYNQSVQLSIQSVMLMNVAVKLNLKYR